jgi:hypothetical protein
VLPEESHGDSNCFLKEDNYIGSLLVTLVELGNRGKYVQRTYPSL